MQAEETLKQGGIIHILPDGFIGRRSIEREFYNRKRGFQPGFAELALPERVPILTVCTFFDLKGKLYIQIFEPFDFGPATISDEEKIDMLVDQYVNYLHKCWQTKPWNTPVEIMKRYLAGFPLGRNF